MEGGEDVVGGACCGGCASVVVVVVAGAAEVVGRGGVWLGGAVGLRGAEPEFVGL